MLRARKWDGSGVVDECVTTVVVDEKTAVISSTKLWRESRLSVDRLYVSRYDERAECISQR